jgi:hypothetical protein
MINIDHFNRARALSHSNRHRWFLLKSTSGGTINKPFHVDPRRNWQPIHGALMKPSTKDLLILTFGTTSFALIVAAMGSSQSHNNGIGATSPRADTMLVFFEGEK